MSNLPPANEKALIRYNHLTYLLYLLSYFTAGLLWIVPIVMNYIKRSEADNTWLATHFDWQIKTFWYSIVFFVIGVVIIFLGLGALGVGAMAQDTKFSLGSTGIIIIGAAITLFTVIWHLYRIVKGWIALADNRPVM